MAELSISPDEIRDALKDFAASYEPKKAEKTEVGTVVDAADGIAHVAGLPGVMANELVRFADGTLGLAQNLEENEIGVVVLGVALFGLSSLRRSAAAAVSESASPPSG